MLKIYVSHTSYNYIIHIYILYIPNSINLLSKRSCNLSCNIKTNYLKKFSVDLLQCSFTTRLTENYFRINCGPFYHWEFVFDWLDGITLRMDGKLYAKSALIKRKNSFKCPLYIEVEVHFNCS